MIRKRGLLDGDKFNGRHTTVIDDAMELIRKIKVHPEINRITISEIRPARSAPRRLKLSPVPAGFKLQVRGVNAVQTFFVYTDTHRPAEVEKFISNTWDKLHA